MAHELAFTSGDRYCTVWTVKSMVASPVELQKQQPVDTRTRLLMAAVKVSCVAGPARMSLDAVAAEAGVSKGGLLYHFPSKHELLQAMIEDHVIRVRARIDEIAPGARESGDGPRALRAYVQVNREMLADKRPPPAGVFAFLAEAPQLNEPIEALRDEMRALARTCADPGRASIVVLACKGLVLETMTDTGTSPAPDEAFDAIIALAATL